MLFMLYIIIFLTISSHLLVSGHCLYDFQVFKLQFSTLYLHTDTRVKTCFGQTDTGDSLRINMMAINHSV